MFAFGLSMLLAVAAPSSTIAQSCTSPDTIPVISDEAPVSPLVSLSGSHGVAQLLVTLGATKGTPTSVELLNSSGVPFVDQAAMSQVRRSTFAPETQSCQAVGGQYLLSVEY